MAIRTETESEVKTLNVKQKVNYSGRAIETANETSSVWQKAAIPDFIFFQGEDEDSSM